MLRDLRHQAYIHNRAFKMSSHCHCCAPQWTVEDDERGSDSRTSTNSLGAVSSLTEVTLKRQALFAVSFGNIPLGLLSNQESPSYPICLFGYFHVVGFSPPPRF